MTGQGLAVQLVELTVLGSRSKTQQLGAWNVLTLVVQGDGHVAHEDGFVIHR
jgi:hypothetical protein